MAVLIWNWNTLFDPGADFSSLSPLSQPLPGYPHTATYLSNSFLAHGAYEWSLTDTSSIVKLVKPVVD